MKIATFACLHLITVLTRKCAVKFLKNHKEMTQKMATVLHSEQRKKALHTIIRHRKYEYVYDIFGTDAV